jgi:Zn-dependent M28 family amino/carboxypeptidase
MKFLQMFLASVVAAGAAAQTPQLPAGAQQAAESIKRQDVEGPLRFLADDLLEGRGPATRGDELTQLYLATQMQEMGLEPAFGSSYEQPFDIVGIDAKMPETLTVNGKSGSNVTLKWRDDYIAASGVQAESGAVSNAELVFVGYGIEAPEYQWNDYKGQNLRGKILVMLNNDPDWDPKLFEGNRRLYYGRWTYKYESAARQGAAGALIIHTTPSAGYGWNVVQSSWTGEQFELPAESEPRMQVKGWVTEDAARRMMQASGHDLAKLIESARSRSFRPVSLGTTMSMNFTNKVSRVRTANVGGLLRGGDEGLSDEVVVYSAHHDHLGLGEPDATGDRIYNGALDNASGVAQTLAIAKAFTRLPERPRRSILFLFVAAEEQGLLGSKYYAEHPSFAPGKIAANVNFDGANIWGRATDVTLIGMGKSSLDRIATHFAREQGRTLKGDQFPDKGFYYRSDQFNFAKIGVPALYFDNGTEFRDQPAGWGKQQIEQWEAKQYHQPSDEVDDSWNYEGILEDVRLGFYSGLAIANETELPRWNPGDEFEAARKKALAAEGIEVEAPVRARG